MPKRPYSVPPVIVALLRTSTLKFPNDNVSPVPTGLAPFVVSVAVVAVVDATVPML